MGSPIMMSLKNLDFFEQNNYLQLSIHLYGQINGTMVSISKYPQ
jgi:hypothetical protein